MPIYKKGNKKDPGNYPVSLTYICSKIMEHIIFSSLCDYLKHFQVLQDEQHGFCQHKSCKTQLISTVHDFALCINQRGQCDVLLLDFCKAFDKVSQCRLFSKLQFYGVQGSLLRYMDKEFSH